MTLQEIMQRRSEIQTEITQNRSTLTMEQITAYTKELNDLDAEETKIRSLQALDEKMASQSATTQVGARKEVVVKDALKERGKRYKAKEGKEIEVRASAVETSTKDGVLIPSHTSNVVAPFPWNEVSSVVDLVNIISLPNGSEYTKAFQISTGEADYTLEPTKTGDTSGEKDGVYNKVTTDFDQVTIKRNKITALDYITEELEAIPDADYASLIERNVSLSLKKKLAKEIILGNGKSNHFVGIAAPESSSDGLNSNTYDTLSLDKIDETTLDNVLLTYGGEEDIESRQVLVMNKKSLKNFLNVRGTANKNRVYNITITNNTATIDGFRVVFTSHLKPFDEASANDVWAVYGDFSKYDVLNFGGEAVETSRDFKFDQGITAVRGKVWSGGGMTGYKAFLRLTKGSTTKAA